MPSSAHSSTTFLNRSRLMTPCRRCISSRGQNTHFALQMFVLSIWTISGRIGARSRPAARSRRRIGLAWLRRNVSAARRAVALSPADFIDDSVLWLTERGDDTRKDFVELDLRLVADQRADPGDVRYAARHVFEAGFVRLVVRDCHDRGRTARHLLDAAGEIADGDL